MTQGRVLEPIQRIPSITNLQADQGQKQSEEKLKT